MLPTVIAVTAYRPIWRLSCGPDGAAIEGSSRVVLGSSKQAGESGSPRWSARRFHDA
jgi:hypothetical protein